MKSTAVRAGLVAFAMSAAARATPIDDPDTGFHLEVSSAPNHIATRKIRVDMPMTQRTPSANIRVRKGCLPHR